MKLSQAEIDIARGAVIFRGIEDTEFAPIVEATRGKSVLTISSGRKAAKMGVAISFVVVGNKMRFVVNKKTIEQNQLTVSSELLDLAIRVHQ